VAVRVVAVVADVPAAVGVLAAVAGVTTIRVTRGSLESRAGSQQGKLENVAGLRTDLRRRSAKNDP
jgi:hypothetical protein